MQTLRKRASPCKYKNDPSRFLGEGITFKAKLIGILEVSEARGDKMCQDALNDLKTAIRAAGEHKQRITISISIDGLRLRDEKTGDCLYHHPVHKISFIAQDMSDSRAFGYIFGSPDTGHRFFGIKTDKTASQVVISMRDLFQVVFELKKKEIEMAKHHSEQHHIKYGNTGYMDSIHFSKEESDIDKGKGKYSQLIKSRCFTSKPGESTTTDYKGPTSEAIADLLDLEHELNSIQQGINQMDKITPSDPFGPLSKGESYIDPFDDSFSCEAEKPLEEKISSSVKSQTSLHQLDLDATEQEKNSSSFFGPVASTSKTNFFSQFSPGMGKSKTDDAKWFDQETESLFNETVNVNNAEPTSSPIALNTPAPEPDQGDGKKSPIKTDLFTELDPLGTGRVKPYVDKKDFFQELKNPPKKVLKELITEGSANESTSFYFPANFKEEKTPSTAKSDSAQSSSTIDSIQGFSSTPKYAKIDPFEDSDPFDKTDPFQEETFSTAVGFPSLFGNKTSSADGIFEEKLSWKFEAKEIKDDGNKNSPTNFSLFTSSTLRVSLPPEKSEGVSGQPSTTLTKLKSPPNSPENSKSLRRRNYQVLKQTTLEGSEDSPVQEEPFVSCKANFVSKPEKEKRSPYKDKFYSLQSPPLSRSEKSKMYSSVEISDVTTPDPPPRAKTSLFSIRPPPLPPKKTSQPMFKPPARPPSLEESNFHYDYLEKKENSNKEELKCVKLKKQLFTGKNSPPANELRKQNSESSFPILPPPPHRKTSTDGSKTNTGRKGDGKISGPAGSVLNIKLNQLDNTGLENLAITLGIPSENIYSMTLQELTKMLAEKYLISEAKTEKPISDSFEVDFDANFAKLDLNNSNPPPPSYDKYAVFKELMENESKVTTMQSVSDNGASINAEEGDSGKEEKQVKENEGQEEDKYAALRQLSLNVEKSETFSEDLDEEEIGKKDENASGDVGQSTENFTTSVKTDLDLSATALGNKTKWGSENTNEILEANPVKNATERSKFSDKEGSKDQQFPIESPLFPLVDQFSTEKKANTPKENWATFEKSDFGDTPTKKPSNAFNENENSPFSSDGKEDVREIPFHWHGNTYRKKTRKDVPWQDDDESWDDYSPKESFCSDESSHEDRSPDPRRTERYEKPAWNLCERAPKTERKWSGKGNQWSQRDKWQEETEDEFEETWRKQRERTSAYESDRKNNFWHNSYDTYNKHYDWCNSRSEPWDENERHVHCYMNRRKRSESDNEYRKRCDSDASDKECVWTFQKNYPETLGRSGKQKQYYSSGYSFRDCPEHCHESRTKHRKGVSQKRPSSASEAKRNYEKMCSPGDYPCRGSDKTYPGKSDKDEYYRYQCSRKDSRHRPEAEFSHYYSSSDKRIPGQHSKIGSRTARASSSGQSDLYPSPNRRNETMETKNHEFDYFEPFRENNYKSLRKSENAGHFNFDSEAENFEKTRKTLSDQSPQDFQKTSERRSNQWASANGKTNGDGFFSARNSNENFARFPEEFKNSPKKSNEKGKPENPQEMGKPEAKSKPHLSMLSRQESSATLRKSDSINIFSRDKDPFEGDDFFSNVS